MIRRCLLLAIAAIVIALSALPALADKRVALVIGNYLPGIRVKTTPTDFYPIEQVQMSRFSGTNWELFGPVIDGHAE